MPAPKSVIKVKKQKGKVVVEYEGNFDAAGWAINELSRAALRDVGRYIKKQFNITFYQHFNRDTGNAGRATKVKVFSSAKTKYPHMQIGLPTGRVDGFHAYFQEFGTSHQRKLGLLTHAAQDNVAEIVKIESQYLKNLSGEAEALEALIDEGDIEIEGDEE